MLSYFVFIELLCVIQTKGFSSLTDAETQNVTLRDEAIAKKTDVFRQLLNQETLIRMSLVKDVQSLVKDMVEIKEVMTTSKKQLHDGEKEILSLKNEVQLLKSENQKLKEQAVKFQEANNHKLSEIGENLTDVSNSAAQYEIRVNKKIEDFAKNTSTILNDIKMEVRYLSLTLLELNKHTMELNMSFPNMIEGKLTEYTANVNRSVSDINHKLLIAKDYQEQLAYNLSLLENDQTSLKKIISATKTGVGFTAGVTTRSDWTGNILVFPYVVTNNGNGYNPSTGKFTAPTDGTYVFFLTVVSNSNKYIYMNIVHNGADKVRTIGHESAEYMTGTNMAVLQLVKGDSVWVSRRHGKGYYSDSAPYTTFSGFLL